MITGQKHGVSAKALQVELGLGSYKTAWMLQHKLRTAMVRPDRTKLSGEIEVDECFVGAPTRGTRGRGTGKHIVAIAVEKPTGHVQHGFGRCRMRLIPDCTQDTLEAFVTDVCERGSIIYTDGHAAYNRLWELGYERIVVHISSDEDPAHVNMPAVHRVASLLKRWLLGTHQGGVARQHLDYYLDECTFRFNRRTSRSRGLLFYRLIELALRTPPKDYETIVWSRRPEMRKLRGRERLRPRA